MGDVTAIEWADKTFNPWEGCQKVGPGCDNCYAETRNARYGGGVAANWGPGAPRRRTSASNWNKPRRWDREAEAAVSAAKAEGLPPPPPVFVFCASLADVFDNAVDPAWRVDLFRLIHATPNLTWLLLTKRPGNILHLYEDVNRALHPDRLSFWPRNAAIGCTVVNQEEADRDIQKLLDAKEALRPAFAFLSMEPLLGPVDISRQLWEPCPNAEGIIMDPGTGSYECCGKCDFTGIGDEPRENGIDWVIVGGESGSNARPMELDWARNLRAQCEAAQVVFNFKQVGGRGADKGGHELDGRLYLGRPSI